ncbi:MAG: SufS family cysteine desulfurase [Lactobacillaceae bacterium]|jgi:cysteine desulfurase/selenocysteine lyase|nr:SufS family cysteine desulfurase [Lactobacillaceae bacterium]
MNKTEFAALRRDFPILDQRVNDEQLIYFDNAATTQKPKVVIDAIRDYYLHDNANIHRGVHTLSERATDHYEAARDTVADFINANEAAEVIFTKGATEGLNWLAMGLNASLQLTAGDKILVSVLEHHANLLPWQRLSVQTGAELVLVDIDANGNLDWADFDAKLTANTKLVALTMMSNVLGTSVDFARVTTAAHAVGAVVIADAAQAIVHETIDVQALDVDALVFSGHKLYAPMGTGVLYGKRALLETIAPIEVGGGIVSEVTATTATFNELPSRLEAGTPDVASAIGLARGIEYLQAIGLAEINTYERALTAYAYAKMQQLPAYTIYGQPEISIISFNLTGTHPHDVATALDQLGIAVRAGHHCAQPLMQRLGVQGTVRASFAFYNTFEEIDTFIAALIEVNEYFNFN